MAFPTIPTGGRVVTGVQTGTSQTRTFPNLNTLTSPAGELIIAICCAYQTTATSNAAFSAWGASFTEFKDQSSSATAAIGCAYKWSSGSETGTFTVTEAATVTGDAVFILMSIPGAHASTPPEATSFATATNAAANPAALAPSWGADDTLWIALETCGETATTGSFTGTSTAPTNYGNTANTGISLDAVGGLDAAVAFRQLNTSSEDVGTYTVDTSNARSAALTIGVRPIPPVPWDGIVMASSGQAY